MNTTEAQQWHHRTKRQYGPCKICGCPSKVSKEPVGEHRLVPTGDDAGDDWSWMARRENGELFPITKSDWHHKPKGHVGKCPTCDCPAAHATAEHRATTIDERFKRKWLKRSIYKGELIFREIGAAWRRESPRTPSGPTLKVREGIARATAMMASGLTAAEAAAALDVNVHTLNDWKTSHLVLWDRLFDEEAEKIAAMIRIQAGTDAVLEDPDAFVQKAEVIEKWCRKKNLELFPISDKPTITSFFNSYYRLVCLPNARPKTLETYGSVIRRWQLLTGDPPLEEITTEMLAIFRQCLERVRGQRPGSKMAANTIRKHLKSLQAILDKAGPPGPRNRDAKGLLKVAPYIKPPRQVHRVVITVPSDTLNDVYLAAVAMEKPQIAGVKPPKWWQSLLAVAFCTGLRLGELLALRFDQVNWQECRVRFAGESNKTSQDRFIHLNPVAMAHIKAIRTDRTLIFEGPHAQTHFHSLLHRLQTEAGIPEEKHFGFHNIRKTAATALWQTSPQAAQFALGHSSSHTTREHYVDGQRMVADALDRLPQPTAFADCPSTAEVPATKISRAG